ncbi:unnamed protein product [Anisakis simplex]|uniref:Uncharacterized protein n=1 Tax=Anisakis simplex TaxID=6269 RepID=A0A0M3K9A8_ANISI|nr:unnamed protein product [Anisakis simplex]
MRQMDLFSLNAGYPSSNATPMIMNGQQVNAQQQETNRYDRREVDTDTAEGQIRVSSYLDTVMLPCFTFMRVIGLYHASSVNALNASLIVYSLLVIAIQVRHSVFCRGTRRFSSFILITHSVLIIVGYCMGSNSSLAIITVIITKTVNGLLVLASS